MLNGLAPIFIFNFPFVQQIPLAPVTGIPVVNDFLTSLGVSQNLLNSIGIPIPIYLDEALGLYVENETKLLDIETDVKPTYDGSPPIVLQTGLTSNISINLLAKRDSVVLGVLLALVDVAVGELVTPKNHGIAPPTYGISYLNGPTTVFGALLSHFSTSVGIDDDLLRITIQLSKLNQRGTIPKSPIFVLPPVPGAVPVVTP